MNNPRRQHCVPRVYLDNFSDEDGRLTVFSKRRGKQLRPKPEKALIRAYYYSQPLDAVENAEHSIETDFLGRIESEFPRLIEQISSGHSPDLKLLYETTFMMRCRSPAFREAFEIGLANYVNKVRLNIPKWQTPTLPKSMPDLWDHLKVSIDPHRSLTAMAFYVQNYLDVLTESKIQIACAPRGQEFLTSDNPVVWYDLDKNGDLTTIYPNTPNPKTYIAFPLTKRLALVGRYRPSKGNGFEHKRKELTKRNLRQINEVQIACAWDEVVGRISLPKESVRVFSKVAPELHIEGYNPESGAFVLSRTSLGPMTDKNKFNRR